MNENIHYMTLAFEQAKSALGNTLPNPAVGAIVVNNGVIVGRGCTQKAGCDHAEVQAIKDAGELCLNADIYVTLEPCCHYGKTPPCTQAIINAGIKKVIGGMGDPNPLVNGKGFDILVEAGIEVEREVLDGKLSDFYLGFSTFINKKRPLIDLKIAQSSDGYIAAPNKDSVQISGPECREWMHKIRSEVDGILVGGSTMIHDNPSLTVRFASSENLKKAPIRFVMTQRSELPENLKLWNTEDARTVLYGSHYHENLPKSIEQVIINNNDFEKAWISILNEMADRGLHRIMVECGANLVSKIVKTGIWDRFLVLTGSVLLEKGYSWNEKMPTEWSNSIKLSKFGALGKDYLTVFENCENNAD